jgi:hypothetical protein
MFNRHMIEHVCFKQRVLLGRRIGIVSYLIFNVKHCKERKKQKDLYSCQHALVTTVNLPTVSKSETIDGIQRLPSPGYYIPTKKVTNLYLYLFKIG